MTIEFWYLIGAALVFFMQAGFAMVETGFTRAKNAGNIIMKNLMDFCIGTVVFCLLGFSLMMAEDYVFGLIGIPNLDIFTQFKAMITSTGEGFTGASTFVFNLVFCATAATIVSGAMAERTKFSAYCIYSGVISLVIYPIEAGWIWNSNGWLVQMGFHDFAGSCAIHMVGGIAALVGAIFVGPRLGKYTKNPDGSIKVHAIPGHSITLGALGASVIGIISGILVVVVVEFLDLKLHVDDPVGAVGVHLANGIWGTIAVGLLANPDAPAGLSGLFYTGSFTQLGVQLIGVLSVGAYATVCMIITYALIKKFNGLRVSPEEEVLGLDVTEHGLSSAYADFTPTVEHIYDGVAEAAEITGSVPAEVAVPVEVKGAETPDIAGGVKMTKVDIICKQGKFEALKNAMNKIGVTGMTVTQVLGFGAQKGHIEKYRGVPVETNLLPKVEVEIVVSKVPVRTVIEAAKKALYTGNIGDGKIFVYNVENVVRVRTGEEGYDALQGEN